MTALGFNESLYILPFDHRGLFQTKMFGWSGTLSPERTAEIAATKHRPRQRRGAGLATGREFLERGTPGIG